MTQIKICGLTCIEDAEILNKYLVSYAGFVMYFPKSKRNVALEKAVEIKRHLNKSIQSVAVTVCPTLEQVGEIQKSGFDMIQIHGTLEQDVLENIHIPIIRAINVDGAEDLKQIADKSSDKIFCYAFDGRKPGNGETFDWSVLKNHVDKLENIMLAGGLNQENVATAINTVHPQIVDVSSSVEKEDGTGKDEKKVKDFIDTIIGNQERKDKI